ncbi:hypothetical protein PAP_04800 [Palaeococcus pacificus DY20341]|uniref:Uncharacterized protein n=1 Tax=Palaeococcus pacificus DY20341 TaxID=1343739 RepID=A0A075LTB9_9EURY|nr:hypothetical protein PAP_04800 [Palaeococcus pacificus DY20341]
MLGIAITIYNWKDLYKNSSPTFGFGLRVKRVEKKA